MNFKELREQLTDEMIKSILAQFNVEPVAESAATITFPTCCHNLEGGSPKLIYYKNTKLFYCFTQCQESFDIFTLLQKMMALRGKEITLKQAIELCDLDPNNLSMSDQDIIDYTILQDIKYLQELNNLALPNSTDNSFKIYDKEVLRKFNFDYVGLMPWIQEGISVEVLQKFNIKYDAFHNVIIIPNFDYNGNLIGLRGRYLNEKDSIKGKYRPLYYKGVLYNHPTGRTFYGIYENHKNIERKHTVIIYEGEKSVLKHGTIYGNDNNIALATLGQNITQDHIQALLQMRVSNVILAYDTDYEDYEELAKVEEKYVEKAKLLSPYFNVSILMDYDISLPYKSSPIDGGKETFEYLLQHRRIIK